MQLDGPEFSRAFAAWPSGLTVATIEACQTLANDMRDQSPKYWIRKADPDARLLSRLCE